MAQYANLGTWTSRLTTGLNTVADGAFSGDSSDIDNSSELKGLADVTVALGSVNPTSTGALLELHILQRSADGSTYEDAGAGTLVATEPVTTGSSAKTVVFSRVAIPQGVYRYRIRNRMGVTTAGSGNTLSDIRYDLKGG